MKKIKRTIALFSVVIMALACLSFSAFAEDESQPIYRENTYPIILVHGLGGWGYYDFSTESFPYWGAGAAMSLSNGDYVKFLRENGYEIYAASIGPVNSAWDRCCELYAQLTGTVVDYGEAHSKEHNHARFGKSFEGQPLMGRIWDLKEPLNLIGHSFGGPTSRLFTSLLAFGDEAEVNATGDETSPLFKGGNGDSIHSVTTLSGCHNGTQVANMLYDCPLSMPAIGLLVNTLSIISERPLVLHSDLNLAHFGLTAKPGEGRLKKIDPKAIKNFVAVEDNAGYDLTIRGSQKLNEKIKMSEDTYYYSISGVATETTKRGNVIQTHPVSWIFTPIAPIMLLTKGRTFDGFEMTEEWLHSDGIVPLASALYPFDESDNAFDYEEALKEGELKKGSWYYLDTMYGMDHGDYCGTTDDYPEGGYQKFWLDLAEMINKN